MARHHKSQRGVSEGYYSGHADRRHQEMQDGGMIREDHSAIANMPQEVMIKPYPAERDYMPEMIDDTIRGVDAQMGEEQSKRKAHFRPHKY